VWFNVPSDTQLVMSSDYMVLGNFVLIDDCRKFSYKITRWCHATNCPVHMGWRAFSVAALSVGLEVVGILSASSVP